MVLFILRSFGGICTAHYTFLRNILPQIHILSTRGAHSEKIFAFTSWSAASIGPSQKKTAHVNAGMVLISKPPPGFPLWDHTNLQSDTQSCHTPFFHRCWFQHPADIFSIPLCIMLLPEHRDFLLAAFIIEFFWHSKHHKTFLVDNFLIYKITAFQWDF